MGLIRLPDCEEDRSMTVAQDFVVNPIEGGVRIHGVPDFPPGTAVDPHAKVLHVKGPVWVRQPRTELTEAQWDRWLIQFEEAGWSVSVEPCWTADLTKDVDPADTVPWEIFRDELLRSVRQGREAEDRGAAGAT
jgi:hypothetical protein